MEIKIIVATHKKYDVPSNDMYLPVLCGAKLNNLHTDWQKDDKGENISSKNNTYCELTGMYWAWKNLNAEYIGLNHYRRYFKYNGSLLTKGDAETLLNDYPVILPKKRHYYIETVYSQYVHAHGKESIDKARDILMRYYPGYVSSFDECMNKRSLHILNMFIMRKDIFDDYCKFLFDVLNKVEQEITPTNRIFGYLGERLFDTFIQTRKIKYKEISVLNKETTNWPLKIVRFLGRKFSYE